MFWNSWTRITVATFALLTSFLLGDRFVSPSLVTDDQLALSRGLSQIFLGCASISCNQGVGPAQDLSMLNGGQDVASSCDATNVGALAAQCSLNTTATYGRIGISLANPGTGMDNTLPNNCGYLQYGQCVPLPIPYLAQYGILNPTTAVDNMGNKINCRSIPNMTQQQAGRNPQ